MADGRFDDLLLGLATKHKTVEELSFSILAFFERRTDLFHVMEQPTDRMGFAPGAAEKMLFKHFAFFQQRYFSRAQPHLIYRGPGAVDQPRLELAQTPTDNTNVAAASSTASVPRAIKEPEPELPEATRKMMKHISTWNGAVTDKYHWTQSLSEVTLEVELEKGCTSKEVKVNVTATRLSVVFKGNTMLEGKLHEKVTVEDHMWYLEDGKVIISLEKQRETWWKCVLEGDQEIDTTKVESTRSMEEYDGETQGAIRKIMFDQRQKATGNATSDQIRTADMMKDAWNAPGSPFRGSEFDPSALNLSSPVPDEFFADIEQKRITEARTRMGGDPPPTLPDL